MSRIVTRALLPLVAASALLAACQSGAPNAAGAKPGATKPGAPGVAAGATAGAPVAAPGVGTNPSAIGAAAPIPTAAAAQDTVTFNDPSTMPFIDPVPDTSKATNLFFGGQWGTNGGYLEQSQGARMSSLTFRQYNGAGFGAPGGVASGRYRADVSVWVYQESAQYPDMVGAPLGILGYAPYYIDEAHYLLAVAKPKTLEVWAVDGNQPGTEWPLSQRLFKRDLATPLAVGVPVAWSVEINPATQSAKVWANNEELATVSHAMLTERGQRVALVSNGNFLHFQNFQVFKL